MGFSMTGVLLMMSVRMYFTKCYTIKDGLNIDNEKMMFSLIKRASMNKALDYIKKSSSKHELSCQEEVAAFLEEQNSVDAEEVFLRKRRKNLCIWC